MAIKIKNIEAGWFVYLLQCENGRIYTGITNDVAARFRNHQAGRGAKFTMRNRVSHVLGATLCENRSAASKLEYAVRKLNPAQKRALAERWTRDT